MLILICIPIFIEIEMLRDSKIHLSDKKIYKYRIKHKCSSEILMWVKINPTSCRVQSAIQGLKYKAVVVKIAMEISYGAPQFLLIIFQSIV